MSSVPQRRLENLRSIIKDRGGVSKLAKETGYSNPSFLSQMAGPNPSREITEKSARKIEGQLGLEPGTLDRQPGYPLPATRYRLTAVGYPGTGHQATQRPEIHHKAGCTPGPGL